MCFRFGVQVFWRVGKWRLCYWGCIKDQLISCVLSLETLMSSTLVVKMV